MTEEELNAIGAAPSHVGVLKLIAEVRRLEAENAALRARAVPAVVWPEDPRESARVGDLELEVCQILNQPPESSFHWAVRIWDAGEYADGLLVGAAPSLDLARSACEAAFLRLIGCAS